MDIDNIEYLDEDEESELMGQCQRLVREMDSALIAALTKQARDATQNAYNRRFALGCLAGARTKELKPLVTSLIVLFLESSDPDLQFTGLANCCWLSNDEVTSILPSILPLNGKRFKGAMSALLDRIIVQPPPEAPAEEIYCVEGITGEYSDKCEWIVGFHTNEHDAEEHVRLANEEAARVQRESMSDGYSRKEDSNKYDPHMQMQYTGTEYRVIKIQRVAWKGRE